MSATRLFQRAEMMSSRQCSVFPRLHRFVRMQSVQATAESAATAAGHAGFAGSAGSARNASNLIYDEGTLKYLEKQDKIDQGKHFHRSHYKATYFLYTCLCSHCIKGGCLCS
jgi:hypothetical protein